MMQPHNVSPVTIIDIIIKTKNIWIIMLATHRDVLHINKSNQIGLIIG